MEQTPGPGGAHQPIDRTSEPIRYLMVANRASPEAVEYPDTRQISVTAFGELPARATALGHHDARRAARLGVSG